METRHTIRVRFHFTKQIIEIVENFSNFDTFAQHGDPHRPGMNKQLNETVSIELARHTHATLAGKFKIEFPVSSEFIELYKRGTISDIILISIIDKWNNVGRKPETVTGDSKYRWKLPLCEPSAGFSYKLHPRREGTGSILREIRRYRTIPRCFILS